MPGSAYPYDPSGPPSASIEWLVTKNLAPGVIVILHDGVADTGSMLGALDAILANGERGGFRFVSIGEILVATEWPRAPSMQMDPPCRGASTGLFEAMGHRRHVPSGAP